MSRPATPRSHRRWRWGWAICLALTAGALCLVPLFNLLAFEFALAMTVPVSALGAAAGIRAVAVARSRWRPGPLRGALVLWRIWAYALWLAAPLLLVPLIPISLNSLRVQNCNYLEGLIFYGVLPGLSLPVAAGWGALAALTSRWPRLLFGAAVLASLLVAGAWFWWSPAVDLFHPLVGYYPGALYDEILPLDSRLLWSRLHDLAWVAWGLTLARLLYTPLGVRLRLRADAPGRLLSRTPAQALALCAATVGLGWLHLRAVRLDLYRTPTHVQDRLGGAVLTDALHVYYPAQWPMERIGPLVQDLQFVRAELIAFFGFEPSRPVAIYLYADEHQKKRLMGAGRTRIAKPWQYGMHVHNPAVGDEVIMHEMAHVFSADIADGPHHLSLGRYMLPSMGLIEGLAEAATWDGRVLDFHQWTAAMQALELAPPIEDLLQPQGFYAHASRRAYTVCGSFVRHLRDTYGPEIMAEAYRTSDVAGAVGRPLPEIIAKWQQTIADTPLSETALEVARARFNGPSIFGKTCAHEIAALRVIAGQRQRPEAAKTAAEAILRFIPGDPQARLILIELLYRQGDLDGAEAMAEALAADERVGLVIQARARERQGDLAAQRGRRAEAKALYDGVLAHAFDRGQARRVAIKRAALDEGAPGQLVLDLLISVHDLTAAEGRDKVAEILAAAPGWPVARYLEARQRAFADEPLIAARGLRAAVLGGLPHPSLEMEALRLIGVAYFRAARYQEAAEAFFAVARRADLGVEAGERHSLNRWGRRSESFGGLPVSGQTRLGGVGGGRDH